MTLTRFRWLFTPTSTLGRGAMDTKDVAELRPVDTQSLGLAGPPTLSGICSTSVGKKIGQKGLIPTFRIGAKGTSPTISERLNCREHAQDSSTGPLCPKLSAPGISCVQSRVVNGHACGDNRRSRETLYIKTIQCIRTGVVHFLVALAGLTQSDRYPHILDANPKCTPGK